MKPHHFYINNIRYAVFITNRIFKEWDKKWISRFLRQQSYFFKKRNFTIRSVFQYNFEELGYNNDFLYHSIHKSFGKTQSRLKAYSINAHV